VWLEFSQCIYPDLVMPGGHLFTFLREDRLYFDALFGKGDLTDRHVLALFEVRPTAEFKIGLEDDELVQWLLDELDGMFQGQASQYFVKSHVQNWSREPYIEGAYSYNWCDHDENLIHALRLPIHQCIYFCGEYLADDNDLV
jgi:hypothetical protein